MSGPADVGSSNTPRRWERRLILMTIFHLIRLSREMTESLPQPKFSDRASCVKKKKSMAVLRVRECRESVLYNDVQNVVVMNTSAFYLSESLMCVADLHAVCFLQCGIKICSEMQQSLTVYIFISIHVSGVHP